jgi:hypothetical protein
MFQVCEVWRRGEAPLYFTQMESVVTTVETVIAETVIAETVIAETVIAETVIVETMVCWLMR